MITSGTWFLELTNRLSLCINDNYSCHGGCTGTFSYELATHLSPLEKAEHLRKTDASIFIRFWVFLFHDFTPCITINMSFASCQTITILGRDVWFILPYWWSTLNWLALLSNPSRPLSPAALCGCLALLPEFSSLSGSLPACLSGSSPSPWRSILKLKSGCLLRPIRYTSLPKIHNCILWCPSLVQTPRQQASGIQPLSKRPSPPLLPQSPCSNVTQCCPN